MIESGKIQVPRTAHFYSIGQAGPHVKNFWIVCHGYAQLARHFIRKFDVLAGNDTFILAPEGLSLFYWAGMSGEVSASWMTKEHRLDEIDDYTRYLSILYDQFAPQMAEDVRITLLGFSQGCATQCRWIERATPKFDRLILWAGRTPEDIDYQALKSYFEGKSMYFVHGNNDPFIRHEQLEWQRQFAAQQGLSFETIPFDGKHEVKREVLSIFK